MAALPHRGGSLLFVVTLATLSGCQTLDRADTLDQLFDPAGYQARHAGGEAPPVRVSSEAPVQAMRPPPEAPAARPDPSRAAVPESADQRLQRLVRQHRWITRFWTELTPGQQRRVARRLGPDDPAGAWDVMGLSDRAGLVFGGSVAASASREAPPVP